VPERIFDFLNVFWLLVISFVALYPIIYVLSSSLSNASAIDAGEVTLFPVGFNLRAYGVILQDKSIWRGYMNTIVYTAGNTACVILFNYMIAYPISRKRLLFRTFFIMFITIPMFIKAGLIPNYLVYSFFGLVNTRWAMIINGFTTAWNILLIRNYLKTIPDELEESALIDGAGEFKVLFSIMLPLSVPILATVSLFVAVGNWNSFMHALIYLNDPDKHPIQIVLYRLIVLSQGREMTQTGAMDDGVQTVVSSLKHAVSIVTLIPIIAVYPFLQRYFIKGIIIGSVKG
jgi:putative aldouronate transport system permease protein